LCVFSARMNADIVDIGHSGIIIIIIIIIIITVDLYSAFL